MNNLDAIRIGLIKPSGLPTFKLGEDWWGWLFSEYDGPIDIVFSCPFCGGEAEPFNPFGESEGTWTVLCSSCAASCGFEHTREEAVEAWNRRVL